MNYEKKVMQNTYEILTNEGFEWTNEFSNSMKLKMIELLLEYFTDIEHYEKCAKLKPILNKLENNNENSSEIIITGSNDS